MYNIYTDGSYKPSTNQGGYASIITKDSEIINVLHAGYIHTTNNRMELFGVLSALQYFSKPTEINIYSDSSYIVSNINNGHLNKWIKDNDVKLNWDLWIQIYKLLQKHTVHFFWVKGHADCELNNLADLYANLSAIVQNPYPDEKF